MRSCIPAVRRAGEWTAWTVHRWCRHLPTGEGLFAFTTMDDALAAIDAINGDYRRHCAAARAVAEEYFEARAVAARLLANVGLR